MTRSLNKRGFASSPRLENLPPTNDGQSFYWDTEVDGFGVRVTKKSKTFIVERKVQSRTCRISLGKFPLISINAGRNAAREHLILMSKSIDPRRQAQAEALKLLPLRNVFDDYIQSRRLKTKSKYDYEKCFVWAFSGWADLRMSEITKAMVITVDMDKLKREQTELVKQYEVPRPGYRRFVIQTA